MTQPTTARPITIEYALVEVTGGMDPKPLPHCGSWYSDRYYTDNLCGHRAAVEAAARVTEHAGGEYDVVEVRRFHRTGR